MTVVLYTCKGCGILFTEERIKFFGVKPKTGFFGKEERLYYCEPCAKQRGYGWDSKKENVPKRDEVDEEKVLCPTCKSDSVMRTRDEKIYYCRSCGLKWLEE